MRIAQHLQNLRAVAKESMSARARMMEGTDSSRRQGEMIAGIYNNPDVWPVLGYEGPSAHWAAI